MLARITLAAVTVIALSGCAVGIGSYPPRYYYWPPPTAGMPEPQAANAAAPAASYSAPTPSYSAPTPSYVSPYACLRFGTCDMSKLPEAQATQGPSPATAPPSLQLNVVPAATADENAALRECFASEIATAHYRSADPQAPYRLLDACAVLWHEARVRLMHENNVSGETVDLFEADILHDTLKRNGY